MDALNARLDKMMPDQQNPTPAPAPASNSMLAKPQPFDGTPGTAAKDFDYAATVPAIPTRSSTGNWWSSMTSSMNLNPASSIKTAGTVPRNLTSTPAPLVGPPAPSTSTSAPTPDPNVMDLSAFQKAPSNRLSDAEGNFWVQQNLCLCCGQAGHISRGCLNRVWKLQDCLQPLSSACLSKIQA
ncbi:uncharacterized protein VP01_7464g1 [Puccinia sorghi]|uniref:CCHC-type domain-containing protein n=1 Tax=Puccinia sorghi TaxID=27349 RepID=A0A0L6UCE7_9BASI|nr:uncharacterized protein VP01_7464g1 [Puccinia sorghi]